jgi:hypothetical protein
MAFFQVIDELVVDWTTNLQTQKPTEVQFVGIFDQGQESILYAVLNMRSHSSFLQRTCLQCYFVEALGPGR